MAAMRPLRRPILFLATFVPVAGVLMVGWGYLSGHYLAALTWLVNIALSLGGMEVTLQVPRLGLHEMVYPEMAGGIALFAVTPGRSPGWRLRWLAALVLLLGALHTSLLYLEVWTAVGSSLGGGATALLARGVEICRIWGTPVLVLLIWFHAVRQEPES